MHTTYTIQPQNNIHSYKCQQHSNIHVGIKQHVTIFPMKAKYICLPGS